jgi:hypothetical protein
MDKVSEISDVIKVQVSYQHVKKLSSVDRDRIDGRSFHRTSHGELKADV